MNLKEIERNCTKGNCPAFDESFLCGLNAESLADVKDKSVTLHFKKGQVIFSQGTEFEGIFCLKKGTVKTFLRTKPDVNLTLAFHKDAGMFGIESLYAETYSSSSICLTDSAVCYFPKKIIFEMFDKSPYMIKRMAVIRQEIIQGLFSMVSDFNSKSIAQRFLLRLQQIRKKFGTDEAGCIQFPLIKEEIASLVGASVESVFRTISDLKQKGVVDACDKKFKIVDEAKMTSILRTSN